jgi:hypothetical protein
MRKPILILALLSVAGCVDKPVEDGALDSDGQGADRIQYAELTAPDWSLDPTPLLRLGSVDDGGPEQFYQIIGATRLPDDRIALINGGDATVRIFDMAGRHISTFGRAGDGPGEFRVPHSLWPLDGGLAVWDSQHQRVTVFDRGGSVRRTTRLRDGAELHQLVHIAPDGRLVTRVDRLRFPTPGEIVPQYAGLYVFDTNGEPMDSLPSIIFSTVRLTPNVCFASNRLDYT